MFDQFPHLNFARPAGPRFPLRRLLPAVLCIAAATGSSTPLAAQPPALQPWQAARAERLHAESLLLIAHTHRFEPADFDALQAGGVDVAVLKLTTDGIDWDRTSNTRYSVDGLTGWTDRFLGYVDQVEQQATQPGANLTIARSVAELLAAHREGRVAAILGAEGAMQLEGELARVEQLHERGWRETQLRWNANQLLDGNALSPFGAGVIRECDRLGIVIDISHLYGHEIPAVMATTTNPVIRSHDGPASLGGEATDALIRIVAESGGGHGVFCLHFGYMSELERVIQATDYVASLVGVEHIGIGADWYPEPESWALQPAEMAQLTHALVARGYSDDAVRMILGTNMLRLYRIVWREPAPADPETPLAARRLGVIWSDATLTLHEGQPGGGFAAQPVASVQLPTPALDVSLAQVIPGSEGEVVVLREGATPAEPDRIEVYRLHDGQLVLIAEGPAQGTDAKALAAVGPQGETGAMIGVLLDEGTGPDRLAAHAVENGVVVPVLAPRVIAQVASWDFRGDYSGFTLGRMRERGGGIGGSALLPDAAVGTIWSDGRDLVHYAEVGTPHLAPVYLTPQGGGAETLDFGAFNPAGSWSGDQLTGGGGFAAPNRVSWWSVPQGGPGGWQGALQLPGAVLDVAAALAPDATRDQIVALSTAGAFLIDPLNPEAFPVPLAHPAGAQPLKLDATRSGESRRMQSTSTVNWRLYP